MKATELIKEIQHIVNTLGDREVEISVAKQPDSKFPDQQYLVADARFVVPEEPRDMDDVETPIIMIRDWPY